MSLFLAACGAHNIDASNSAQAVIPSPFAETKVKLATPTYKVQNKKRIKFNAETDAIPASVILDVACAKQACANSADQRDGRLTCYGYKGLTSKGMTDKVKNFSFHFVFDPAETPEDIEQKISQDTIDQKCIVGVSNHAEFIVTDAPRVNDSDTTNANYSLSPFLDQIKFFDSLSFMNSFSNYSVNYLSQVKVGVIDGDFYAYNSDIPTSVYITDLTGYAKQYKVENSRIINIGGAPLAPTVGSGHGSNVSELISGTINNGIQGAGLAAGSVSGLGAKLVAANVYSINASTGNKTITIDDVNNALFMMTYLKVDVINMSLVTYSTSPPSTMLEAISKAVAGGAVVVVAAGNDTFNITQKLDQFGKAQTALPYPAKWGVDYLGVVSVAALNAAATNLSSFSNFGKDNVDIAAPGTNLFINGIQMSGTSFSSPLVTGAVALISGFYKSRAAVLTPAQIELALLSGSPSLPAITNYVNSGKILDLSSLATQLQTQPVPDAPTASLDTGGFTYVRNGTSMTYTIRTITSGLLTSDPNVHIGIWEQLDLSLPPLIESVAANGTNIFEQPFYNFVVGDEGFWVVLYRLNSDNKRIMISAKLYKFTDIVTNPSVAASPIFGEINQVDSAVQGWVCLGGRPEHLNIEAHVGSASGPLAGKWITNEQPKGREYFDACSPFVVTLGFKIPLEELAENTAYYFVAVHPTDSTKNKVLNPSKPFIIETRENAMPIMHSLKKSITATDVTLKGSVCWVNQSEPGSIGSYFYAPDVYNSPTLRAWIEGLIGQQAQINGLYITNNIALYWRHDYGLLHDVKWSYTATSSPRAYMLYGADQYVVANSTPVVFDNGYLYTKTEGITLVTKENIFNATTFNPFFVDKGSTYFTYQDLLFDIQERYKDITTTTVTNAAACTSQSKTGLGQDFTINIKRSDLLNQFTVANQAEVVLADTEYSDADRLAYANDFNRIFNLELANRLGIMNTVINKGEMQLKMRVLSHSTNLPLQTIDLSKVPNY